MSVATFAATIAAAIKNRSKQSNTFQAQILGNGVIVDGSIYPFTAAIDTSTEDGDWVWVIFNEAKSMVVVIGK